MEYERVVHGRFLLRRNRFIAEVLLSGAPEICHVKNTGRLKELLLPGAEVLLSVSGDPKRKTKYDLIAVESNGVLVNIDSQAPNRIAADYLPILYPNHILHPEYRFGASRLDFCLDGAGGQTLVEVKGVTLLEGKAACFPDAPTERGLRHVRELIRARELGLGAAILFVVQRNDAASVVPNDAMQPAFGEALRLADRCGVQMHAVDCLVTENTLFYRNPLPVLL